MPTDSGRRGAAAGNVCVCTCARGWAQSIGARHEGVETERPGGDDGEPWADDASGVDSDGSDNHGGGQWR